MNNIFMLVLCLAIIGVMVTVTAGATILIAKGLMLVIAGLSVNAAIVAGVLIAISTMHFCFRLLGIIDRHRIVLDDLDDLDDDDDFMPERIVVVPPKTKRRVSKNRKK